MNCKTRRVFCVSSAGRSLLLILLCWLLAMIMSVSAAEVRAQSAGENVTEIQSEYILPEGGKQIRITVVEDIPAAEIEESEVPLAALPNTPARAGMRHAVWMGILFAAVLAYVIYFSIYDRKLFSMRREAARREQSLMALRRTGVTEGNNER